MVGGVFSLVDFSLTALPETSMAHAAPRPIAPPHAARSPHPALAALLVLVVVVAAWSGSFSAPFELDDHNSIIDNATILHLWPPAWLQPPATAGETVSGRPVLNLSFAIDYALGGLDVRGYHITNLLIHVSAALLLFGIVRRTLFRLAGPTRSDWPAIVVALLWAVHPLQTEAVTYVVQRAESLAGCFLLLTLYAFIRSTESRPDRVRWAMLSVGACLLGVGTKETAAVAPIIVLLYDRAFISASLAGAWRAHRRAHLSLMATWLVLAVLVVANHGRGGSAGLQASIGPWNYALTQCEALVRYLGLALWPVHQVFDYGVPTAPGVTAVLPQALLLLAFAVATGWALARNRPAGFVGAWGFLALAPSSSFVPVATQTIAEHRMYVALASIVVLAVAAARKLLRLVPAGWLPPILATVAIGSLGAATFARNQVYRSELALWTDTAARRPDNPRAHHNLGLALLAAGQLDAAAAEFHRAIALRPNHAFAHFQLGGILLRKRAWPEAVAEFEAALSADPHYVAARVNLGNALAQLGRKEDAVKHYRAALADDPEAQDARTNLAGLLIDQGLLDEAEKLLHEVLAAAPNLAQARYHLGILLDKRGQAADAEQQFRVAVKLKPTFADAQLALGNALAAREDEAGATACYREAMRLDPRSAEARYAWGNLLASHRRLGEAIQAFREALALDPTHLQARNNLANCQLVTGDVDAAIANYEEVLHHKPDDAQVRENLRIARQVQHARATGSP